MSKLGLAVVVVASMLAAESSAFADYSLLSSSRSTPFDRGHFTISVAGGTQRALGYNYFGVGAGVGYFVLDGLEVGLFGLHEFGNGPSLNQVRPSLTYVAQPLVGSWPLVPYIGAFYKHWFIGEPFEDVDGIGLRAGVMYLNGRFVIGLGFAFEHVVSTCYVDCDDAYPDISVGFTF
jgi:hypothetical protein